MFSLRTRLGLVAIVSSFAVACGSSSYNSPNSPTAPSPSAPTPPGAVGSSATISIPTGAATLGPNAFNPSPLTIPTGTTVTWTNGDSIPHTSTANVAGWNSGTLAPGQQFNFTFSTSGTFQYHCAIHPGMIGTVIVQ
jgi:plastocyanin